MAKKVEVKIIPNENIKPIKEEWVRQSKDDATLKIKNRWWFANDNEIHRHVFAVAEAIEANQKYRETQFIRYARLYANMDLLGFAAGVYSRTAADTNITNRITLNVVKSCVDTAAAKISKNKPKPMFLTEDGDFNLQNKAKKLTKYIEGLFDSGDLYEIAQRVFVDATVFGLGAIKIYAENDQIKFERIIPNEIMVDDAEGIYSKPRQLHQKKYVHREVLLDMFPDHASQIMKASSDRRGEISSQTAADQIVVLESWHLPSGEGAGDGKHVISINNCTLYTEQYDKMYFPFVFFRWSNRLIGFYGQGLAEELVGIQIEINKLLRNIQLAQHLMAVPRIFVEDSSNVVSGHLNNEIGAIVKYTGTLPTQTVGQAMSPEVYRHLENLYNKAYEITGISQLSAQSSKPAGLNSGIALREFQDIESERFIVVGQRYEKMFLDVAEIVIDMSRDLYQEFGDKLKIKVKGSKFIETIPWSDVDLENDKFSLRVFPVSFLPSTPAGKLQTIQELTQAGFIGKEQALSLLDFPDLEGFFSLETAALDDIKMLIGLMIDKGEYQAPEPFMNLQLAIKITQSSYLKGKTQKVPEERLDLLRRFIVDCQALITQATQPPEQSDINEAMPPQAVPEARPSSELLPQQPVLEG